MADNITNINEAKKEEATRAEALVVSLSREYDFEGQKIKEIDFSGLEEVTAKTMVKANKVLASTGDIQIVPESSLHYSLIIAADCTDYPIEFFEMLRPADAMKVKNTVTGFFYGEDLG